MPPALSRADQSELILSKAHASVPDGILVVDSKGKIVAFNRRFTLLWGLPNKGLRGSPDRATVRRVLDQLVDPQGFQARVRYLYDHPRERSREELLLKDGRVFERHSAPIFSADRRQYGRVWYFRDITERKRGEERLRERERLRLHREFVANVSHELRTPLTAIEGFTETLLNGALDDARNRRRFLRTIIAHSRRLRQLVDGLLDFSRQEAADLHAAKETEIDLRRFIKDLILGIRPVLRRKSLAVSQYVERGLTVRICELQLCRILGNLLDNAAKYSRPGGRIRVAAERKGSRIVLSVEDRGIGIAAADLPKIFDRFHRSSTARRHGVAGNGLGLALVKQLVESRGGSIGVESREGKGTAFRVSLKPA